MKVNPRWMALVALPILIGLLVWKMSPAPTATSAKPRPSTKEQADTAHNDPQAADSPTESVAVPHVRANNPEEVELADAGALISLPWGPQGLGRGTSEDGYPGGPNSFLALADGTTWIIDQFNGRMVRVDADGKILEKRPLELTTPADIALSPDGTMTVIDRTRDFKVQIFDPQGKPLGTLPLPPEEGPSELMRVFTNNDKVYGQRGIGGPMYLLGGLDGTAESSEDEVNGQPSRDGKLLISAGITNYEEGRIWASGADPSSGDHLFTRVFFLDNEIEQILLLDSDRSGMMYLVLKAVFEEAPPSALVMCLDGNQRGKLTKVFALPYPEAPLDTFRKYDVNPEGGLMASEYTEAGAGYRMHSCR